MAELRVTSTGTIKLFESDDTSSVTIASPASLGGDRTITLPDANVDLTEVNTMPIANLDIDGGTDIGANIADSDLLIIDDGAGGTNRKTAASRIKTYVGAGAGAFDIGNLDIDGGTDIGAAITDSDLFIIDDGAGGTNRKTAASRLKTYIGGGTHVQTGRTVISGGNPSSVDVNSCFSSTYDTYLVVLDRIESTVDSQNLSIRLRNDSGSVTASNYRFANRYFHDASTTENTQSNAADKFTITNDTDDSSNNGGLQGIMYVHRPADANTMTRMNFFHSFFDATGNDLKISIGTCNYDNPEAHTGISLNISSGGVRDAGSITVYGIAYSQEIFMTKVFDNVVGLRDMTVDEQAQYDKDLADWNSKSADRKLSKIRLYRNLKLIETDYLANSDVTMSDAMKTWRQTLRDLPQNNTTEAKYDELLARDSDGKLTHSVWTKPS